MYPTPWRPAFGSFVRDQVEALGRLPDVSVEVEVIGAGNRGGGRAGNRGGGAAAYLRGAARLVGRRSDVDVVHAHFGLSAWPALAVRGPRHAVTLHGTDLVDRRSRAVSLAALPFLDLVGTVSAGLAERLPGSVGPGRRAVLPCGVALDRFTAVPREAARRALGLDPAGRYLLFAADPSRPEKRFDRAAALARALDLPLLTLGNVPPRDVPLWINAADAVIVTSARESFGLAALEALACSVPVLSTPVGIAREALADVPGTLCEAFDLVRWREFAEAMLGDEDPRVAGRSVAERWSADAMARRLADAWRGMCAA